MNTRRQKLEELLGAARLYSQLASAGLVDWCADLDAFWQAAEKGRWGKLDDWLRAIDKISETGQGRLTFDDETVCIQEQWPEGLQQKMQVSLRGLIPWRKGPFNLHGAAVDAEWDSRFKWRRLQPVYSRLKGSRILDIGCGNGWYIWRMLEHRPELVIGLEPSLLYTLQFNAVARLLKEQVPAHILPLTLEEVRERPAFDLVFSMGVLYHRRSPFDHLQKAVAMLADGGQLLLETMVIEGGVNDVLVPEGRYAMMNNVYFLPSSAALCSWLRKCGLNNCRIIDESATTTDEQRTSEYSFDQSLPDYLDRSNPSLTVEGLPAPRRAVIVASR